MSLTSMLTFMSYHPLHMEFVQPFRIYDKDVDTVVCMMQVMGDNTILLSVIPEKIIAFFKVPIVWAEL